MERIDDNTIAITQEEADRIQQFIDCSLDREWDRYTDNFICDDS